MTPDWLTYANQGATRNLPLDPKLVEALSFLGEMGLGMEVFSGGQPAKGSGGARVGSTRHDLGHAADVFFRQGDRRLNWANEQDLPIIQDIVRKARAAGVTGIGAGEGYMQPGSMHIGFGSPSVWGAGGRGENAPAWLKQAYYGGALDARQQPQGRQYALDQAPASISGIGSPLAEYAVASAAPPAGPVEAAGGGAGSEATQTPPTLPAAPAAAKKKNFWELLGEGISEGAGAMAKGGGFNYQVPTQPGPARVDVGAAPIIDPQQAEQRRMALAQAMARLNQGSLW